MYCKREINDIQCTWKQLLRMHTVFTIAILQFLYELKTKSSSPWSEEVKEQTSTGAVINEKSVNLFIEWMKSHQQNFPEFDHAMAFTAYNLRKEGTSINK